MEPQVALESRRFGARELADEIDALQQEMARRDDGLGARTLVRDRDVNAVLFAMRRGARLRRERLGGSIRVLAGHLDLHVGKHCGDEWDLLPFWVRHTEGACSFFALDDDTIDLSVGSFVVLESALVQDIEAIVDSAFIHEARSPVPLH
jgi:hypothetical protein